MREKSHVLQLRVDVMASPTAACDAYKAYKVPAEMARRLLMTTAVYSSASQLEHIPPPS